MKRIFSLTIATAALALLPTRAMADQCTYDGFDFPGTRAARVGSWTEVFKAVAPDEKVPGDDDDIGRALCFEAGCQAKLPVIIEADVMYHLVTEAPGGGMWLFSELDFAELGQCSRGMVEVAQASGQFLLLHNPIEWGERVYCDDDDPDCPGPACAWAGDEYKHWLVDTRHGVLMATAGCGGMTEDGDSDDAVKAPKVDIDDGSHIKYYGCGRYLALNFGDIRGCANARARADAKGAKRLVNEGRKLTRSKDLAAAIARFSEALALDPGAARAWSGRGYARLLQGDLDEARADFDKALALNKDKGYQSAIWFNLGLLAEKKGDDLAAVRAFSRAFELKPRDAVEKKLRQYQDKTRQRKLKRKPAPSKHR